ncbi:orotidine-5'-phosphate decarboxylase [bacterium]|nr:orotidine-5'-phosphate decarboxylase [bacterium]
MDPKQRLIVALDVDSLARATPIVEALAPHVGFFKVGLELITAVGGPTVVHHIQRLGGQVFYDAKFNDIPNTVGAACRTVGTIGAKLFTVHASAGLEALQLAAENKGSAECYAVTVLTSFDDARCQHVFGGAPEPTVLKFAADALEAGVDGIVCSALELEALGREERFKELKKIVPGIRPSWSSAQDQKRVMTPAEAIKAGADYLVIGRPIMSPPMGIGSPIDAVQKILAEIQGALA